MANPMNSRKCLSTMLQQVNSLMDHRSLLEALVQHRDEFTGVLGHDRGTRHGSLPVHPLPRLAQKTEARILGVLGHDRGTRHASLPVHPLPRLARQTEARIIGVLALQNLSRQAGSRY